MTSPSSSPKRSLDRFFGVFSMKSPVTSPTATVFLREFKAYFATPLAAVFLVVFLALGAAMTFFLSGFFQRGSADLAGFFVWMPWLMLILLPALGMRLWAEERRTGMIELLMTLPVTTTQLVVGKFLAGWAFAAVALLLTLPLWLTVNWLGSPDNGVILAGYFGSLLMAAAFLAVSAAVSALTKNQVIAFIGAALLCFVLISAGLDLVLGLLRDWAPQGVTRLIQSFSVLQHFTRFTSGILEVTGVIFFVSLTVVALFVNVLLLDLKKAQ